MDRRRARRVPLVPRLRAALVVEELTGNVRRHGRLPCVLRLGLDDSHRFLQVFVDDFGADDGAVWAAGSGLSIVDALTSHWAVKHRLLAAPAGHRVMHNAQCTVAVVP